MTKENLTNRIVNNFQNSLKDNNFNLFTSSDYHRVGVVFKKDEKCVGQNFRFLIEESLNEKKIYGFEKNIVFLNLEKILVPILAKNDLVASDSDYKNRVQTFKIDLKDKHQLPEEGKKIENDSDIDYVSDLFIKFYQEDALPYFEYWNNLTVLYDYIKELSDDDLWDVLGQFAPMKKAIIFRLCNDSSALEFITNYYEEQKGYYEEDSLDEDNIRYYNASKELKEILENTKPIYNVEV